MTRPPNRYRPTDALSVAEAVFKPATPPAVEPGRAQRKGGVPVSKELVSIKLDSDLIAHFQEDGPGWQERINDALRRATGLYPASAQSRMTLVGSASESLSAP